MKSIIVICWCAILLGVVGIGAAQNGSQHFRLEAQLGRGNAVTTTWSPDGAQIAVGGSQGIWLYTADFQDVGYLELPIDISSVISLAWSFDGQTIAAALYSSEGIMVQLWDTTTFLSLTNTVTQDAIESSVLFWSPDQSKLAMTGTNNIHIWDQNLQFITTLEEHPDFVTDMAWHPDSLHIASISLDGSIRIWNTTSGQITNTFQSATQTNIPSLVWSPDGDQVASSSGINIEIWDVETSNIVISLQGHSEDIVDLSWTTNGLASTSSDASLKVWDAGNAHVVHSLQGLAGSIKQINWSPVDNNILMLGSDSLVRLWIPGANTYSATLYKHNLLVKSISWNSSGNQIASGDFWGRVQVWDVAQANVISAIPDQSRSDVLLSAALHPSASNIAYSDHEGRVRLWDTSTNQFMLAFQNPDGGIGDLIWSFTGNYLAGINRSNVIEVWDSTSWQEIVLQGEISNVQAIVWSPSGNQLISGAEDGLLQIWDITSRQAVVTLQGHTHEVVGLAWSFDGTRIVSASADRTIRIWDAVNYQLLQTIPITSNSIYAVAWRPHYQEFLTSESDGLHFRDQNGEEILVGHFSIAMRHLTWTADGQHLAGVGNGIIYVWSTNS